MLALSWKNGSAPTPNPRTAGAPEHRAHDRWRCYRGRTSYIAMEYVGGSDILTYANDSGLGLRERIGLDASSV